MVKIKTTKQLNLPQLIEYAWENGIENKEYPCVGFESKTVIFNGIGWAEFSDEYSYNLTDTFIVEEEIEITEDTVIPKVLNVFKNTTNRIRNDEESHIRRNVSVKEIKENSKSYIENDRLYIMNDDLTLTLIWTREKGLVG